MCIFQYLRMRIITIIICECECECEIFVWTGNTIITMAWTLGKDYMCACSLHACSAGVQLYMCLGVWATVVAYFFPTVRVLAAENWINKFQSIFHVIRMRDEDPTLTLHASHQPPPVERGIIFMPHERTEKYWLFSLWNKEKKHFDLSIMNFSRSRY